MIEYKTVTLEPRMDNFGEAFSKLALLGWRVIQATPIKYYNSYYATYYYVIVYLLERTI